MYGTRLGDRPRLSLTRNPWSVSDRAYGVQRCHVGQRSDAARSSRVRGSTVCCKSCTAILLEPVTSGHREFSSQLGPLACKYDAESSTWKLRASILTSFCRSSNRDPSRSEKLTEKPDEHNHRRTTRDNFYDRTVSRGGACENLRTWRMRQVSMPRTLRISLLSSKELLGTYARRLSCL